jgi:hypothetical protein
VAQDSGPRQWPKTVALRLSNKSLSKQLLANSRRAWFQHLTVLPYHRLECLRREIAISKKIGLQIIASAGEVGNSCRRLT